MLVQMLHPILIETILLRRSRSRRSGARFGGIPYILLLLLTPIGLVLAATPAPPSINTNLIFDVTNTVFAGGALGDGVSNSAAAIQAAISMASTSIVASATGGTVRVRAVGTFTNYLCGPISLKNNVNLLIDSGTKLQMLPFGSYPTNPSPTDFISASNLHDIEISGSGTIDGQGGVWWATNNADPNGISRPKAMFAPSTCSRVLVQNVTLQNPPNTHISFRSVCGDVTVDHIRISTPDGTPNTDGMDMSVTNALVQNSFIADGDDNIAMGDGHSGSLNKDIVITNCTFGAGHGVSIGSYTIGGLSNLLVVNCSWNGTGNGIRLKSQRGRGGLCQSLVYRDLTMTNVDWPILIYSYYNYGVGTLSGITPFNASTNSAQTATSTTPIWRNITFSNVTATSINNSRPAFMIWGLPEMLVSNVSVRQCNITGTKSANIYSAQAIQFIDSPITVPTTTNTFNLYNAQLTVTNSAANTNLVVLGGLALPPTNNALVFFNANVAINETNVLGTGPITLGGSNLTIRQTSVSLSNNVSASGTSTLTFTRGTNTFIGALTGSGLLTVALTNSNIMLAMQANASGFAGTLALSSNGTLRLDQGVNAWGDSNVLFDAGMAGAINNHSAGNIRIPLGGLTGRSGSMMRGSDQTGPGVDTYVIGGRNSNAAFAGTITNGTAATAPHLVALTKTGNAAFTLTGANSYGGGTTVSNGTLLVNNPRGSATGTGAVTVVSGATLGGNGFIAGPVTVSGTLALGGSPGTLTIGNSLSMTGSTILQYDLGTNSDRTVVSGDLTLDGILNVTDAGGFTNATYTLLTYGGTLTTNGSPTILAVGNTPDTNKTYVIDISTAGQVNLIVGDSTPPSVDPFVAWQLQYFGCTNLAICPQVAGDADADGDGMNNTNEFLSGTDPTNSASALRIISTVRQTTDVVITWTTAGGFTNAVQVTPGDVNGNYATNFTDISEPIIVSGSGDATTNYTDSGGATNGPSRFYRIRLVP